MAHAPLILAAALSFIHYLVDRFGYKYEKSHKWIISLAMGVFLTFLFLELMPRLFFEAGDKLIFYLFIMMWGFIIFHIMEKHVYKHVKKYSLRYKEINELDIGALFIDNLLIGVVIVVIFLLEPIGTVALLSIPFVMHTISSSLSLNQIYSRVHIKNWMRFLVTLSVFIGAVTAYIFPVSNTLYLGLLAFIIGVLLFTVSRDLLPKYKKGSPMHFILGNVVAIIILLLRYII